MLTWNRFCWMQLKCKCPLNEDLFTPTSFSPPTNFWNLSYSFTLFKCVYIGFWKWNLKFKNLNIISCDVLLKMSVVVSWKKCVMPFGKKFYLLVPVTTKQPVSNTPMKSIGKPLSLLIVWTIFCFKPKQNPPAQFLQLFLKSLILSKSAFIGDWD